MPDDVASAIDMRPWRRRQNMLRANQALRKRKSQNTATLNEHVHNSALACPSAAASNHPRRLNPLPRTQQRRLAGIKLKTTARRG